MNRLNFSMLEIIAESENHSLRDDGFVPNISEHSRKVYREFMGNDEGYEELTKQFSQTEPAGRFMYIRNGDNNIWIIFYKHADHGTEIVKRGHEETHVLHGIGQIELLQQLLAQKGLDISLVRYANFEECSDDERELVANIGGLYAMENKGFDIAKFPLEINDPEYHPALRLYQAALQNRFK